MANKLNPYPMPPDGDLPEVNLNALRGHILGVTLDNATTPGVDDWFITSGAASNRNALLTTEKMISKLLNSFSADIGVAISGVNGFSDRFTKVIGNENSEDRQAFDKLGSNLINALVNFQELSTDLVGLPEWDSNDYTLTFRTGAGDEVVVNLPLESLAMGLDYDHETQEIILIKYDGSEIRVSIGDLVSLYEGYESSTVTTEILTENKIKATINLASIGIEHLKTEVLELLGGATVSEEPNNMLSLLSDGLFVPKINEVAISAEPDNLIEKKSDGLYVPEISADNDNFVGIVITEPATEINKQVFPMGSSKPSTYLTSQLYAIMFTNGHTASTLRLAFDTLPLKNVVYNNEYTIPADLIPKGSMHLFAYTGSNFVYVGKNFEQLAEGVFTTTILPNYKTYGELTVSSLIPVGINEKLMLNSMIIDDEGRLAKVKGIGGVSVTVYTIKDSDENETSVDHDSVRYNASRHLESVKFVDNNTGNAVGKITNEPIDLAQSELAITTTTANQRIVSIRKSDDSVSWQLRIDKGAITNLNIDEDDNLLNRGQIINLMHEIMGSALHTPVYIDFETELPAITLATPDGTYYIIGDMDLTAPGHAGRAWVNLSISTTEYQKIADKGVDADNDWIVLNEQNEYTFNTEKIVADVETVNIITDFGKVVGIEALLQVNSKISDIFLGSIRSENDFPMAAVKGNWCMIENCNLTSPGNPGLGVFDGTNWIISAFEVGMGNLDIIPEPLDDGRLYFRSRTTGESGEWIPFQSIDGKVRTITFNMKNLNVPTDASWIPAQGELIYLEDIANFTIGDGTSRLSALPLMYVGDAELGYTAENVANKGIINGYAPLDATAKIPATYLPSTLTESYTETQVDTLLEGLRQSLQTNINLEAIDRQTADNNLTTDLTEHIENENVHVTSLNKTSWDNKLDTTDLLPVNNHMLDGDIHVTLMDKLKWDGNVAAYLVSSIVEMQALDPELLKLGDTCFVRLSAAGVTPANYAEYIWYGVDGWNLISGGATVIDLEWAGIKNKPSATAMAIDTAVTNSHKHNNQQTLDKINELSGQLTFNGVPIGATIVFLTTNALLPSIGKEDMLYVIYRDSRASNFPTLSVWRNTQYELLSGGSGGGVSPAGDAKLLQRDLFGVIAGSDFLLNITENINFAFFPIEVLRLIEGPKNQVRNYTTFSNPNVFNFNPDLIRIQGGLSVGPYEINMELDTIASSRYYYSKEIDITNYHSVAEIF